MSLGASSTWWSEPVTFCGGEISVPGDKSMSHRALILAAIADGPSMIEGFLASEDCLHTQRALQDLGVAFDRVSPQALRVHGVGRLGLRAPQHALDCGNSGTSMRLLAGLLAPQAFDSCLIGDASLSKRPMNRVRDPLLAMGADLRTQHGHAPVLIHGAPMLRGIDYPLIPLSAQVKSALLLAGLYATGRTRIHEGRPTRDHTERMLQTFAYPVHRTHGVVSVQGGGQLRGCTLRIPGDFSSAAFFMVAATLIPGASLMIRHVGVNPTRLGLWSILTRMGAKITCHAQTSWGEEPVADVVVHAAPLHGIDVEEDWVVSAIDEIPILCIAAACASGRTRIRGVGELRYKESDRIAAMTQGLRQLGCVVETIGDDVCIEGGVIQGGVVDSLMDHRVAMSFAIAGAVAQGPVQILRAEKVSTSFPDFLRTASQLQLKITEKT